MKGKIRMTAKKIFEAYDRYREHGGTSFPSQDTLKKAGIKNYTPSVPSHEEAYFSETKEKELSKNLLCDLFPECIYNEKKAESRTKPKTLAQIIDPELLDDLIAADRKTLEKYIPTKVLNAVYLLKDVQEITRSVYNMFFPEKLSFQKEYLLPGEISFTQKEIDIIKEQVKLFGVEKTFSKHLLNKVCSTHPESFEGFLPEQIIQLIYGNIVSNYYSSGSYMSSQKDLEHKYGIFRLLANPKEDTIKKARIRELDNSKRKKITDKTSIIKRF